MIDRGRVGGLAKSLGGVIQAVDAGFFVAPPKAHPSRVYVVSYRDGHLRSFIGIPSATDRLAGRFCYHVDTRQQHAANRCTVASAVDGYSFSVELSATWRVTDPEAAVLANLSDGNGLVLGALQDMIWQVGRRFQPDRAAGAEAEARTVLARQVRLASGIAVLRAAARFEADAAVSGSQLDLDSDAHQGALERQRMARLREMFDGSEAGALMLQLMRHPDDTASVLAMMNENRDKERALRLAVQERDREHYLALLDRALAKDLISDSDAEPLRNLLFGQSAAGPLTGSVAMVPIAGGPPLSLPQGIGPSGPATPGGPVVTGIPGASGSPAASGGGASTARPVMAQGYVIEDVPVTGPVTSPPVPGSGPAEDQDIDSPASASPAPDSPARGGVKAWKPLKKPDQ